ncbi:MAG: NAD(P)H-dependent oxidoreductase [Rhizobiaceae bacterium]|nr:NAD(P)H-dependent oxidoreductase [Rhizobiaceae bacterium]
MNILFVLAHPEPKSFNARLVELGRQHFERNGNTVEVSDLYGQRFDPVEKADHYACRADGNVFAPLAEQRHAYREKALPCDIEVEIGKLERADLVIFQFPVWWHSTPAILKGWLDRVFVAGGLYTSRMRYDRGYFRGKRALCSVTSGAPEEVFVPGGRGGEISQILWSLQFSLHYMGFCVLPPHASFGVAGHGFSYVDDETFVRQFESLENRWLSRLAGVADDQPLCFPGWDEWDDLGRPKANGVQIEDGRIC